MSPSKRELHWLHGASRRPRYLAYGPAWRLYPIIDDLQGTRRRIERCAVASIGRVRSAKAVGADARDAWERLQSLHEDDIHAALFVYTGYYKDTVLSGV